MAEIKALYGTAGQLLTCQLAPGGVGLVNNGQRSSAAIDNTSNLFLDALVQLKIKSGSGVSATGYVDVYAYGSTDGGTTYPEGTGTDAGVTLTSPPNLTRIGRMSVVANTTTYISEPMSVAAAFGGILPAFWGIVIENKSGAALDTTESNHAKLYQGIKQQVG
jgi:hypothetical protein